MGTGSVADINMDGLTVETVSAVSAQAERQEVGARVKK